MSESSGALKEVQVEQYPRLEFNVKMRKELRDANFTEQEIQRTRLAVNVLNTAFDLMHYVGPMPRFMCNKHLIVDGVPRIGGFFPEGFEGNKGTPIIAVDVSKTPANNASKEKFLAFPPAEHLREFVNTLLEEAKHFVDYKLGLSVEPVYDPGHPLYPTQPHELRAKEFVIRHSSAVNEKFKDFVQYYE